MSRNALLKRKPRKVEINGEPVWVRSLTLGEALHFDDLAKSNAAQSLKFLAAKTVVEGESGEPSFTDEDDPGILEIPTDVLKEIGEKVTKASSSGSVDSAEKNSETTS